VTYARIFIVWIAAVSSALGQGRVDHIFFIVKENRSADMYFGTYQNSTPGLSGYGAQAVGQCRAGSANNALAACYSDSDCDGTTGACLRGSALENSGTCDNVTQFCLSAKRYVTKDIYPLKHNYANGGDYDCAHGFGSGTHDVNNGLMDKFDLQCGGKTSANSPFTYYNQTDFCSYAGGVILSNGQCSVDTLWNYAINGTFMDHFFASMLGPSYPNHLYLIAGQSNQAVDNPAPTGSINPNNWNCDSAVIMNGAITTPTAPYTPPYTYPINTGSFSTDLDSFGSNYYYKGGQCNASADSGKQGNACICHNPNKNSYKLATNADCGSGTNNCTICTDQTHCGTINQNNCTVSATSQNTASGCVGGTKGCLCPNVTTIADQMDAAGVTWHYYAPTSGSNGYRWNPISYIQHLRFGNDWTKNVSPAGSSITDISTFSSAVSNCSTAPTCSSLAKVVWVSTGGNSSGHPGSTSQNIVQADQSWTVSVVQAIQANPTVYSHSIIFILWDDWGGFYDHVVPPSISNSSWGIRVPAICVGPFCQNGVSHVPYEFSSLLQCVETPPYNSITSWSIKNNVATFRVSNSLVAGQTVALSGFTTSTFFNGQTVTVSSTGLSSSQFQATFMHANASRTEAGQVAPWAVANLGQQDTNGSVNNICAPPGAVSSGEWTTGGVINLGLTGAEVR